MYLERHKRLLHYAKHCTLDEVQTHYYEKRLMLVRKINYEIFDRKPHKNYFFKQYEYQININSDADNLLTCLLRINRIDEIIDWIIQIEPDDSLCLVAYERNLDIVKKLVKMGAKKHIDGFDVALQYATCGGKISVVEYLLKHSSLSNFENTFDVYVISQLVGNCKLMKYLFKKNDCQEFLKNAMFADRVDFGDVEMVKFMLENGKEYDYKQRRACVYNSRKEGNKELAKFFIDNGTPMGIDCPCTDVIFWMPSWMARIMPCLI